MNALVKAATPTEFNAFIQKHKNQMDMALPKHITGDRMARLALTCFSQNEDLRKCSLGSIFSSIIVASQLGLEIGVNGQGYLIPYKGTCTFVPGWKGLQDLVNRTGRATSWTGAVFEGDKFSYSKGTNPRIDHEENGEDDISKLTHVYAVGRVNGSEWPIIEVWTAEKVKKHFKKNNKVGERHYGNKHFEMYARKVVLLQVLKYLPASTELTAAIDLSLAQTNGRNVTLTGDFQVIDNPGAEPREAGIDGVKAKQTLQDIKEGNINKDTGVISEGKDPQEESPIYTYIEVREALTKATTKEQLSAAAKMINGVQDVDRQAELDEFSKNRQIELQG